MRLDKQIYSWIEYLFSSTFCWWSFQYSCWRSIWSSNSSWNGSWLHAYNHCTACFSLVPSILLSIPWWFHGLFLVMSIWLEIALLLSNHIHSLLILQTSQISHNDAAFHYLLQTIWVFQWSLAGLMNIKHISPRNLTLFLKRISHLMSHISCSRKGSIYRPGSQPDFVCFPTIITDPKRIFTFETMTFRIIFVSIDAEPPSLDYNLDRDVAEYLINRFYLSSKCINTFHAHRRISSFSFCQHNCPRSFILNFEYLANHPL